MSSSVFCPDFISTPRDFFACLDFALLQVMKEMLIQTFGVPSGHRAAKPFHDHVISFFYLDGRVWLRHYQVPTPSLPVLQLSSLSQFAL
jgi:hypothetical protein